MLRGPGDDGSNADPGGLDLSPVVLAHEQPFHIADVQFRPATREVLRDDQRHVIEPRVMQLLVALHRAAGAVVSKDDLGHLIWEGRIVGEDAINRVVSRLRAVAAKQAGGVFKVETITKVGYRLQSARGEDPDNGQAGSMRAASVSTGDGMTRRATLALAGAAAAATAVGSAFWFLDKGGDVPPEARTLAEAAEHSIYEDTPDGDSDAIGALRQAVALAPDNARIWGLLGSAYMSASRGAPSSQSENLRVRANAAIQRAFAIEPGQPDAVSAQITGMPVFRNWLAVERACRAALSRHPDNLGLRTKLNYLLMQVGRTREALPAIKQVGRRLPDIAHVHTGEVVALWSLGRLDEADAAISRHLARWPRFFALWFTAVYMRMYEGRPAEALAMIRDVGNRPIGIPAWNFDSLEQQAAALASGDRPKIADAVRASIDIAHRGTGFAENAASFAAFVGDFETAFSLLNALYFNQGFSMPDAYFSPEQGVYSGTDRHTYNLFVWQNRALRRDPRFAELTRKIGLGAYWAATNSRALVTA